MNITEMTYVSYFFLIMAALFGITAIILCVTLDIRRCWRIVRGNRHVPMPNTAAVRAARSCPRQESGPENISAGETQRLSANAATLLLEPEETVPLGTMALVQDIVMMDAELG